MKITLAAYVLTYLLGFFSLFPKASWGDTLVLTLIFFFMSFMGVVFGGIFTSRISSKEGEKRFSFAFYKVTAFFIFGFLGECLSFYAYSIALYVLWLLAFLFAAYVYRKEWMVFLRNSFKEILQVETLFLLSLFGLLLFFGFRGLVFGGEKPMDIQFLHIYQKLPAAPHWEPWSWGERIKYYVLGYRTLGLFFPQFLFSVGMQGYFYALAQCLVFTQFILSLYAFFFAFLRRSVALGASLCLALAPNFVALLISLLEKTSFESFWRASRLFEGGKFTEFPFWSFIFGDLHPHFIASPMVVSIFTLFTYLRIKSKEHDFFPYALCGIFMAILVGLNIWDALILSLLIVLELVFSGRVFYLTQERLFREYGIFTFFFVTLSLGFLTQVGKRGDVLLALSQENMNSLQNYFWHYGLWWCVLGIVFLISLLRKKIYFSKFFDIYKKHFFFDLLKSSFVLLIPLSLSFIFRPDAARWDVAIIYFFISFLGFSLVKGQRNRFFVLVIFCLSFMVVATEHFSLMDRWNTLFKFNFGLWILFALPCSLLLLKLMTRISSLWKWGISTIFICIVLGTTGFMFLSLREFPSPHKKKVSFSLDTGSMLDHFEALHLEAAEYLLSRERNPVVVLEAPSSSYDYQSPRLSVYSGHPSFVTWFQHLRIHGIEPREIRRRRELVSRVYSGEFQEGLYQALKNENIDYIFIGAREKRKYGEQSLESLATALKERPQNFSRVYYDEGGMQSSLYEVR